QPRRRPAPAPRARAGRWPRTAGSSGSCPEQAQPFGGEPALADRLHPVPVVDVPADRRLQPLLEAVSWRPAELVRDLAGVDGVAVVVPRPVGDEGDLLGVRPVAGRVLVE